MSPLYFAYGSNMAAEVLLDRVEAEPAGRALLRGYRLAFTLVSTRWGGRAADIVPDPDGEAWGRLWLMDPTEVARLGRYEAKYDRIEVLVEADGDPSLSLPVFTYTVKADRRARDEDLPAPDYLDHIRVGAAECGLPEAYRHMLDGHAG